jgi:addiction module RelB/DinJ family antitoxin
MDIVDNFIYNVNNDISKGEVAMPQINVNIRMDESLKRDFEIVCGEMGLTMTTAFTVFAKAVSSRKEIPFKIAAQSGMPLPVADGEWAELSGKIPVPGCMRGQIHISDDFDTPLDDFEEYM